MEASSQEHVIGIPLTSIAYADEEPHRKPSLSSLACKNKQDSFIHRMSKLSKRTDKYVQGFKEHITLGPKISETVKGKLSLGAKILQAGGIDKVFRQYFSVEKDEKLLKAFQCYLSTTAGPIAGMLFISTKKIAFHSDKPLNLNSPKGVTATVPYKKTRESKRWILCSPDFAEIRLKPELIVISNPASCKQAAPPTGIVLLSISVVNSLAHLHIPSTELIIAVM